jgi:site-specific DNA recombinase
MNAAIYCRVSTDDQEKEGTSLKTQLEACLKYCQEKGYAVIKQFSETYSGTTLDRPQLTQLRDLVAAGEVDVIVIYCLDRISRDPTHGVILTQEFENLAVRLEAVTETVESTDLGKLISYIRGFASKLEVEKIRERTLRGKAAHLKQGHLPTGTGIGPYGYKWDKTTKKRVIVEQEADTVRRIFSMLLEGKSLTQIAKSLNEAGITSKAGLVWCHTTVRRTATNPIYAGETYYGRRKRVGKNKVQAQERDKWISLPDVTPAIISKEAFEAAQESIKRKYRPARRTDSTYFLTGFTFCPECGSPLCGATLGGKYRYYRCRGTTPTRTRGPICTTPYVKADQIEAYVWDRLVQLTQSPSTILFTLLDKHYDSSSQKPADLIPTIDKQIKALSTKLKTYGPKEQNLIHLYAEEQLTKEHLLAEVKKMREREVEDKRHIDQLLQTRKEATTATRITLKLSEYSENLKASLPDCLTPQAKREFLDIYGVKVAAARGKYKFCCFADMTLSSDAFDEEFEATFTQALKDLEKQHPEITLLDLMDYSNVLPEDHPLARHINETKKRQKTLREAKKPQSSTKRSYTTIERTSA